MKNFTGLTMSYWIKRMDVPQGVPCVDATLILPNEACRDIAKIIEKHVPQEVIYYCVKLDVQCTGTLDKEVADPPAAPVVATPVPTPERKRGKKQ